MKKLTAALLTAALLGILTSCKTQTIIYETTEASENTSVIADISEPEKTSAEEITTAKKKTDKTPKDTENKKQETTTAEKPTLAEGIDITEVDLTITLPEKNGTMKVDLSPDNKYIAVVAKKKGVNTKLLAAVFSVPESGQNYVFEFTAETFTKDNLRRVYLIDGKNNITGIAAAVNSEKEGLSSAENWFCINVLIKGVIFPAIEEQF